ncbi:MAG: hypothetical protein AAGA93_22895 [Actinomycetota bacterium]
MTRPDPTYLRRSLRATAREAVWLAASRHRQGPKPNICLFATRRGGSTWAMELIAANRGIRPLNQPLATLSRNVTYAQMLEIPRFHEGQITSLDGHTAERMKDVVTRILSGRMVVNAPTKFWSREFVATSDRLVLKITDAKPVIDWFDATFDVDVVVLTRHPIPQALSCLRNGWTLTVESHLRDPRFVEANLSDKGEALAHDVLAGRDELLTFVLNWALENVAPLRLLPERPEWLHVRYEDCVTDPDTVLVRMADRLQLDDRQRMEATLARPSGSSRRSKADTVAAISAGRAAGAIDAWRDKVDADQIAAVERLLDGLGIDLALVAPRR